MSVLYSARLWGSGKQETAKSASLPSPPGWTWGIRETPGLTSTVSMRVTWYELPGQAPVDTGWPSCFYVFLTLLWAGGTLAMQGDVIHTSTELARREGPGPQHLGSPSWSRTLELVSSQECSFSEHCWGFCLKWVWIYLVKLASF